MLEPVFDLLGNPGGASSLRRSEQDQIARLTKRGLDRRPQMRRRRQARVVAKHAQSPPPVPGLAELLHHRLQRRGARPAFGVAIANERVVTWPPLSRVV